MLKELSLQVRERAFATTLKQNEDSKTTLMWNINAKKQTNKKPYWQHCPS